MELLDLYDENRVSTGQTMYRGEKVPDGFYRLVVHVCIISGDGKMLIQKRQQFKHGWGGLWDFSVGGSVSAGESSRLAAEREVCEELGLPLSLEKVRPGLTLNFEDGFDDIYIVKRDVTISELTLQETEVAEVKWAGLEEIIDMIESGEFIPYHKSLPAMIFHLADFPDCHTREDNN